MDGDEREIPMVLKCVLILLFLVVTVLVRLWLVLYVVRQQSVATS